MSNHYTNWQKDTAEGGLWHRHPENDDGEREEYFVCGIEITPSDEIFGAEVTLEGLCPVCNPSVHF